MLRRLPCVFPSFRSFFSRASRTRSSLPSFAQSHIDLLQIDFARRAARGRRRPLLRMGDPLLTTVSPKLHSINDKQVNSLLDDMCATLAWLGNFAGLAAPQIGQLQRVIVFDARAWFIHRNGGIHDRAEDDDEWMQHVPDEEVPCALLNAEYEHLGDDDGQALDELEEGCFSVPYYHGVVPRPHAVRVRGQALDGSEVDVRVEGFLARVLQHEIDHLDGVLFPMRMNDLGGLTFDPTFDAGCARDKS